MLALPSWCEWLSLHITKPADTVATFEALEAQYAVAVRFLVDPLE